MRKITCSLLMIFSSIFSAPSSALASQQGSASWYGGQFHGRTTASGSRFNKHEMTCASRSLRFGTKLRVTNLKTGKSIIVLVNDRGPYVGGRIIDLSQGAFSRLAPLGRGVIQVKIEVVNEPKRRKTAR